MNLLGVRSVGCPCILTQPHLPDLAADRSPPGRQPVVLGGGDGRVPYFASVLPHIERMEPGFAQVSVPNWFFVHNHLRTVHAIASCNAAEVAMGMLMEATVPTTHRWIPKAMTVNYLDKATTSLRATARIDVPDFAAITEGVGLAVPVSITDRSGKEVVHADITTCDDGLTPGTGPERALVIRAKVVPTRGPSAPKDIRGRRLRNAGQSGAPGACGCRR